MDTTTEPITKRQKKNATLDSSITTDALNTTLSSTTISSSILSTSSRDSRKPIGGHLQNELSEVKSSHKRNPSRQVLYSTSDKSISTSTPKKQIKKKSSDHPSTVPAPGEQSGNDSHHLQNDDADPEVSGGSYDNNSADQSILVPQKWIPIKEWLQLDPQKGFWEVQPKRARQLLRRSDIV